MSIRSKLKDNMRLMGPWDILSSGTVQKEIKLRRMNRLFAENDPIQDYDGFCVLVKELEELKFDVNCSNSRFEDSRFYGYYQAMLEYAKYPQKRYPVLTGIEHGVRFGTASWPYYDYHTCYVCEGAERIHELTDANSWMPVVAVGPYIHYASQYYSEDELHRMKEKNGKTLLVFPTHSCEWIPHRYGDDIVDYIYNRYAPDFDTVMVCYYWRDVLCDEMKKFRDRGAKIVSAGFRGDAQFIRRLKSMITLSDLVIGNAIGTNIGFCMYMGKPFVLEGTPQTKPEDRLYSENTLKFYDAFSWGEAGAFSDEQLEVQRNLYQRFWGSGLEKSPQEMYAVFSVIDKLIMASRYNIRKMHEMIREEWKQNRVLSDSEHRILRELVHGE